MKKTAKITALFLSLALLITGNASLFSFALEGVELPFVELHEVPDRISREDLNAIPVATADMTEDQLRQICVDFMRMQQSFTWTSDRDLDYMCPAAGNADENGLLHCLKEEIYGGFPYGSGGLTLYNALEYYDPETGFLDAYETLSQASSGPSLALTNNCGTAVMWALGRICTSVSSFNGTVTMTQKNGFLPIGPYTYDASLERFDVSDSARTKIICNNNGEQTMFESYAQMKKADGMVVYTQSAGGHTRLVSENAVVVRKSNGSIDGAKSYVKAIEQYSTRYDRTSGGETVHQHGQIDKTYTFSELYKSGYLPFTIAELNGTQPVEKASVKLSNTGTGLAFSTLRNASLSSNYYISKVILTVTGADGTVKERIFKDISIVSAYNRNKEPYKLTNLIPSTMKLSGSVKLEVVVGSGETITAYEGDTCYNASGSFFASHNFKDSVVPASCAGGGYTLHTCTRCGESYKDQETPAGPHAWGEVAYTWSEDFATCTATRTCATDPAHVETETANASAQVKQNASCTVPEITTYTAAFTNTAFTTQTKDVETASAPGHDWGEITYTWSDDFATCTATRSCAKDLTHVETETVNASSDEANGKITYTAVFENEAFATQTKVADAPQSFLWGDANGDGMISSKDIVRLKNYLANYNAETGTSTVTLGPK